MKDITPPGTDRLVLGRVRGAGRCDEVWLAPNARHFGENRAAAHGKATRVAIGVKTMNLRTGAERVAPGVETTLTRRILGRDHRS